MVNFHAEFTGKTAKKKKKKGKLNKANVCFKTKYLAAIFG